MTTSLVDEQLASYNRDGFVFPIRVLDEGEASDCRSRLEASEEQYSSGGLPRPIREYVRVHTDVVMPLAAELALDTRVLDKVESILGPDILVWGAEFFIKEPHSAQIVSMHQDLTYWGFGETSDQVTAWIALSPATVASGCMDFVAASHRNPILEHNDTHAANNLLSRGQEVQVDVAPEDITHVVLEPGEMSLHHGLTIHGSAANSSADRRIGIAIRYVTPQAGQAQLHKQYAMLARGRDNSGKFIHFDSPDANFSDKSLALYEEIRESQARTLADGMDADKSLYSS